MNKKGVKLTKDGIIAMPMTYVELECSSLCRNSYLIKKRYYPEEMQPHKNVVAEDDGDVAADLYHTEIPRELICE